jgi:hypothetical protein
MTPLLLLLFVFLQEPPPPASDADLAAAVARAVALGQASWGILVDGAGIGSCMAANKVPGVLAATCHDEAAAKNSVLASATAMAASTAKLATTGHVSAVSPDLSAPSAVAARCTSPYILEPISRLRWAAARVTVTRSPAAAPALGGGSVRRRAAS